MSVAGSLGGLLSCNYIAEQFGPGHGGVLSEYSGHAGNQYVSRGDAISAKDSASKARMSCASRRSSMTLVLLWGTGSLRTSEARQAPVDIIDTALYVGQVGVGQIHPSSARPAEFLPSERLWSSRIAVISAAIQLANSLPHASWNTASSAISL